ncbi:MAG: DsrE family protein [SAR324 cluster bacterium]|nr:DsrE family protein [SAR324 cluster bacterium]
MGDPSGLDLQIIIASGLRDIHRAVLGFATALASAVSDVKVIVFLTMEGAVWADENEGNTVQVEGFETISKYISLLQEANIQIEACSSCIKNFCPAMKKEDGKMREGIILSGLSTAAIRTSEVRTVVF